MEIYLIRHGECDYDSAEIYSVEKKTVDPTLTHKGIEQAHRLADRLKKVAFERIYASDLVRATQTAGILSTTVNTEVVITERFREIDAGALYKKDWNDFPEIYAEWEKHEDDVPYPEGENGADVWRRCKPVIDEIIASDCKRVAVVCHGGTIRSIVCGVLGIPQQRRFYFGSPPMNCSVSVIVYKNADFYLHTFNDYSHL